MNEQSKFSPMMSTSLRLPGVRLTGFSALVA